MIQIPQQLQNPNFRFCLLKEKSKIPFEKDWANKGYKFNDKKLLKHIENGGNYGVIGGYGNLIILDKDSDKLLIDLDTFCIETGSGGKHYYILSDYPNNHVFFNELGELRAKNYQVVGCGSTHPNGNIYKIFKDIPIKEINRKELAEIIHPYLRTNDGDRTIALSIFETTDNLIEGKDTSRSGLEYRKVLALLRKGKDRKQIYEEMNAYSKWSSAPEQYRTTTFEKAEDYFLKENSLKKQQEEIPNFSNEEIKEKIRECYFKIIPILKRYLDWKEENYTLVALWIIGTYFHNEFPSFPYLFLNATKGSGKSRGLNLITTLSKNGSVLNSLTEAVLFRTHGTMGVDEFEGIERKGKESLKELLNSAYKKGVMVKRMKKVKIKGSEQQIVEEFDVYRPLVIANISGMESVLGDRCIPIIIEKSFDTKRTDLLELFLEDNDIIEVKKILNQCSLCRCSYYGECMKNWNNFVLSNYNMNIHNDNTINNYTINTNYTNDTNYTNYIFPLYNLKGSGLTGRNFELSFPLLILSLDVSNDVSKITTLTLSEIFNSKKDEDLLENSDTSLIDMISQESEESETYYTLLSNLVDKFRQFTQINDEWLNAKWMGRALKRLNLIKEKRRTSRGIEVMLKIKHAQEKIRMFK